MPARSASGTEKQNGSVARNNSAYVDVYARENRHGHAMDSAVRTAHREGQDEEVRDTGRNDRQHPSAVVVLVHVAEKRVQILHSSLDETKVQRVGGKAHAERRIG